ncbi:MAG: iron-sulfur cluster assembly scaffold protein [Erythrobacter sp.]|uniref:iron-sulfur cluster assembly scaffold protein n=1 Tax=Erythrobacter sp. TaxID=1042 RepID=UPI0032EE75DC
MSVEADGRSSKLYSPSLLALAASLADYPLEGEFPLRGEGRSRTCGSTITLGLEPDAAGRVARIGMQVAACAVGQSSAAILAGGIAGRSRSELAEALDEIAGWLEGADDLPEWPGFAALVPAREHPGRHGALLMPWRAALDALSQARSSG